MYIETWGIKPGSQVRVFCVQLPLNAPKCPNLPKSTGTYWYVQFVTPLRNPYFGSVTMLL